MPYNKLPDAFNQQKNKRYFFIIKIYVEQKTIIKLSIISIKSYNIIHLKKLLNI